MIDVLLGLQWGDEGKGKIVDYFAGRYDVVARFQGGPNAGHTLYVNDKKVILRTIPSGVFHSEVINVIGNGVVLDPVSFQEEAEELTALGLDLKKKLFISEKTSLILPTHRALDKASELAKGKEKIGSTLRGIGPAYMDKTGRNSLRVGDILSPDFKEKYEKLKAKHLRMLAHYDFQEGVEQWEDSFFAAVDYLRSLNIVNGEFFINDLLKEGKKIMAEGAQGSMLDVDFGTYPYVTSSNTISSAVCTGLGVAPSKIGEVIGVTKAYCTRVGSGPFPTELFDEDGEKLAKVGNEFGAVTGRPRRCGWIDLVALKYTCMLSGVTQLVMTKADVLDEFDHLRACTTYQVDGAETEQLPFSLEDDVRPVYTSFDAWKTPSASADTFAHLPEEMHTYLAYIEKYLEIPIQYVSTGPGREQILVKED